MTFASSSNEPFSVLIAGAGVAGLEAALALRDLDGRAAQQGDTAAPATAALAALAEGPPPFRPVIAAGTKIVARHLGPYPDEHDRAGRSTV